MAPQQGDSSTMLESSSGGRSGSSFCSGCDASLELLSDGYKNIVSYTYLVLATLDLVFVFVSLIVVCNKPWLDITGKKDRGKFRLFVSGGFLVLLGLALFSTDSILHMLGVTTTLSYSITFIFKKVAFYVSDILVFALVYRCIETAYYDNQPDGTRQKLRVIHTMILIVMGVLQAFNLGWYIYNVAIYLGDYDGDTTSLRSVQVAYATLTFIVSIDMVFWSIVIARRSYKHGKYFLVCIAVSLCIKSFIQLFYVINSFHTFNYSGALLEAYNISAFITSIITFVCLALMCHAASGRLHGSNRSDSLDHPGIEMKDYASPSPYASEQDSDIYTSEGYQRNPQAETAYESSPPPYRFRELNPIVQEVPIFHRSYEQGPQYASVPSEG